MTTRVSGVFIAAVAAAILLGQAEPGLSSEAVGYLGVYQDETAGSCEFTPAGASYAYVVLTHSIPARELTFTAPKPPFIGMILFESSSFSTTGDTQTGITIDLGTCLAPPVTVMTIYHLGVGSTGDCPTWPVGEEVYDPYTYEFVDCDGVTRQGKSAVRPWMQGCCYPDNILTPYGPYPPDGATGVPTNVTMSWLLPELIGTEWIYISDEPYPPGIWCSIRDDYFTAYEPDFLLPNTTYYWMVGLNTSGDCYEGVRSDFWSFTTGDGPVATEVTTWGRIKAMYER